MTLGAITLAGFMLCQWINNDFTNPGGPLQDPNFGYENDPHTQIMKKCFVIAFLGALGLVGGGAYNVYLMLCYGLTMLLTGTGYL
jgi:hypothetical protein